MSALTYYGMFVVLCSVAMCVVLWRASPWNIRGEWMGLTIDDIRAQRAMLERGEQKRREQDLQALRDQFAVAALTGLLADPMESAKASEYVAAAAYEIADAMIRERQKAK